MIIKFKKTNEEAIIPYYHTDKSSGFDLHALNEVWIEPGQTKLVDTGLSVEVPDCYEMQVRPRSGLTLKTHLKVHFGTIDSDYRGTIGIICWNAGPNIIKIVKGDRIAQGVIAPVVKAIIHQVRELSDTNRGEGGFGSTNKNG